MDGAAHLYNSNLISTLAINSNSPIHQFYSFNKEILPNWSGHFLLSVINYFFEAFVAEKILLIALLIFFPLIIRAIIHRINSNNILVSYFAFPFTYSLPFWFGFYNFFIGLLIMLLTIYFWLLKENSKYKIKDRLSLFLLLLATYFSHLLVFCLLLIIIGLRILFLEFEKLRTENATVKNVFLKILNQSFLLLSVAIIPLFFTFNYFFTRNGISTKIKLPLDQLMSWITKLQPLIVLNQEIEERFTKNIFFVFCMVIFFAIIQKLRFSIHLKNKLTTFKKFLYRSLFTLNFWFICCLNLFVLIFYLPNEHANASYISIRILLLFFIFFIFFIASINHKKIVLLISAVVILYNHFQLNYYYTKEVIVLGNEATRINNFAIKIKPNSVVLPLNFSNHWFTGHFSNYLGVDNPIIILENYEAVQGYFPLDWNRKSMPNLTFANLNSGKLDCINWESNLTNKNQHIDYVFVMGNPPESTSDCNKKIFNVLNESFELIKQDGDLKLYKFVN